MMDDVNEAFDKLDALLVEARAVAHAIDARLGFSADALQVVAPVVWATAKTAALNVGFALTVSRDALSSAKADISEYMHTVWQHA
jgi:hypothetical protein